MNERLMSFLEKVANENEHYGLSIKWFAQKIQAICDFDKVMEISLEELSELLIQMHPTNKRNISYYLNVLRQYARFVENQRFIEISHGINVNEIWNKYSNSSEKKQKYLSYSEFQSMIFNIQMENIMNVDYYITLLQSIYEGIYSDDFSALKNLRGQNIHKNIVIVRCDDIEPFELEISNELSDRLKELSALTRWERRNCSGEFTVKIEGDYPDSCFKVENRSNVTDRDYRDCYYRYIRKAVKITKLGFPLRAKSLYISGIIHRVKEQLENKGMTLEQTFAFRRKWGEDIDIVKNELERVHYPYEYREFAKLVTGYISDFQDD